MDPEKWDEKISRMRLKTLLNPETPWVFPTETKKAIKMMVETEGWDNLTPKKKRAYLALVVSISEHTTNLGEAPVLEGFGAKN